MADKIVLIDGHSILSRAFYGIPDLTNAAGLHTNAVYGFLNIMFKILEEEKPKYLAVAFDLKAPTFRHKKYEAYKGTRKPMPAELHEQVPVIRNLLQAMGILIMNKEGYEADDILGTMAKRAQKEGLEVSLVSGDRDLLQIADTHIKIRIPKTKPGKTEVEDYYPEDVLKKYQVTPEEFIDLKALMGDSSDNIPGVPKVGEKTATELIVNYHSLEGIYEHLDEITKKSIRESLSENRELAFLCRFLARIDINAEIPYQIKDAEIGNFYTDEAYEMCKKLELKSFYGRFSQGLEGMKEKENKNEFAYFVTDNKDEISKLLKKFLKAPVLGISILESDGKKETIGQLSLFDTKPKCKMLAIAISSEETNVCIRILDEQIKEQVLSFIKSVICGKKPILSIANCKEYYFKLLNEADFDSDSELITKSFFDPVIAAYLLNPNKNDYSWQDISSEYLNEVMPSRQEIFKKEHPAAFFEKNPEAVCEYLCKKSYVLSHAYSVLRNELKSRNMLKLFDQIEMPLSLCLAEMEKEGIYCKPEELKEYGNTLLERINELEKMIYEKAGVKFNINSPKQLGEILFEQMQIPGGKKTKTGYSTAADVLEALAPDYPIVSDILEYRGLTKLKSTYADGLASQIADDGRIHTTFQQTVTATGRLSSTEPNLQNIPIRMELGRKIRKVFVPKDGCIFMDSDYSQIELRILAHMSNDSQLIEAYKSAEDIHAVTASKVFHVPLDEVTPLLRRNAKAVNFGIVYGISSFGLSQDLSISKKEAEEYIKGYFESYPGIKAFLDECVENAKNNGYSETLYHRRRPILELKSSQFMVRKFGERIAMNAPIQGTAADIMKLAMIGVRDELRRKKCKSKILLQVHDELLLEVYKDEKEKVRKILSEKMEQAASLAVPLDVDLHEGESWYDAK